MDVAKLISITCEPKCEHKEPGGSKHAVVMSFRDKDLGKPEPTDPEQRSEWIKLKPY